MKRSCSWFSEAPRGFSPAFFLAVQSSRCRWLSWHFRLPVTLTLIAMVLPKRDGAGSARRAPLPSNEVPANKHTLTTSTLPHTFGRPPLTDSRSD
jgi:hypothetical protein